MNRLKSNGGGQRVARTSDGSQGLRAMAPDGKRSSMPVPIGQSGRIAMTKSVQDAGPFAQLRMRFKRRIARSISDLWNDVGGGVLIEATLVIPIGVFLFLGVSEFAQGFTVNRRVEAAAGMAADLVTRQPTVSTADLDGIKRMLDEIVRPYPTHRLRLRLTSMTFDEAGQATIAWSFATGPGISGRTDVKEIKIPAGLATSNSSVVFAETVYSFQSTLSILLPGGIVMRGESYFPPRFGEAIELEE